MYEPEAEEALGKWSSSRYALSKLPENLLTNPGFETGDFTGWDLALWSGDWTTEVQSDVVKYDDYAARLHSDAGADASLQQTVPVSPNAWYKLSGWAKTENIAEVDTHAYTILGASELDSDGAAGGAMCYQDSPAKLLGDRDWTFIEMVFKTTPRTKQIIVEPNLSFGGQSEGTIYWDAIILQRLIRTENLEPRKGARWVSGMGLGNGVLVYGKDIAAGNYSDPININAYRKATIEFTADTAGTLTIEVDTYGDDDWRVYDTISVSANTPEYYLMTGNSTRLRIKYDTAATATAKVVLR